MKSEQKPENAPGESIINIYTSWANNYDFIANVYTLIGHRMNAYRKRAVSSLGLEDGDTVVDLACGTGLNFPHLQNAVGPNGKIIGVDITDAMLKQAEKRIESHSWNNVELVHTDVAKYKFPPNINGVLSTLALSYLDSFDSLIKRVYDALPANGRFAELNFKEPNNRIARQILLKVLRPFGGDMEEYLNRHIWESVERHFDETVFQEFYFGTTYIVTGKKKRQN